MAQTRQDIEQLLASIGREPVHRLGQHFMIDGNLIGKLAAQADPADNPVVLEVGPGTGSLTESLLAGGVDVLAVELDKHLANLLDDRLGVAHHGRFDLVTGDVLASKHQLNHEMVTRLSQWSQGGVRPVRLIANLPYNIASPLLAGLIELAWRTQAGLAKQPVRIDRLVFTVQREVAERLSADPDSKAYGPLSVLCQGLGRLTVLSKRISPNVFYPRPNVQSAMLRIDLPPERLAAVKDLDVLSRWLNAGFAHRRKMLSATLHRMPVESAVHLTTAALALGLDLTRRGETLSVAEYLELAAATAPGDGEPIVF